MGYPNKNTVNTFIALLNRDGLAKTISKLEDPLPDEQKPVIAYLKAIIKTLENRDDNELCIDSYGAGFLTCFHVFRMQIESDDMDMGDLDIQLKSLQGWIEYLEVENLEIKSENTKLREVSPVQKYECVSNSG